MASIREHTRVYPLAKPEEREKTEFINWSGLEFNTVHANDFHFYEEVNAVIQGESAKAFNLELIGLLLSIGIQKGQEIVKDAYLYKDSVWFTPFLGG